jgi:hypothetical protein
MESGNSYRQRYGKAKAEQKIALGLKMTADEEYRNAVSKLILQGAFENRSDNSVLAAHFAIRCFAELPFHFRDAMLREQTDPHGAGAIREALKGAALAYNSESNLPDLVTRNFQNFRTFPNFDTRGFEAFRQGSIEADRDYLEMSKMSGEIEMLRRKGGQKINMSDFDGEFSRYKAVSYAGGMQWDRFIDSARQVSRLLELAAIFRDSSMKLQTEKVYETLVASALSNTTDPHISGGTSLVEDIIKTLNTSAGLLSQDLKEEVGVDAATTPLLLYVNAADDRVANLTAALRYTTIMNSNASNTAITARPFLVRPTYNLRDATGTPLHPRFGVMVYPGRQNAYADKRMATTFTEDDIFTLSTAQVVEQSFVVACDNNLQQRVVEITPS